MRRAVIYVLHITEHIRRQRASHVTVYRRPDPIPLRHDRPIGAVAGLAAVRPEQDNLPRLVGRQIFKAILSGQFAEGSILPNEATLSRQLAVSRTALREAIKALVSKGLVDPRRRRGTLVLERSHWNMLDGDLINWSRRIGHDSVSDELWSAVASVLPVLAENAARRKAAGRLAQLASLLASSAEGDALQTRQELLLELARLGKNRFLASLVAAGLTNLARDDPKFLARVTTAMTVDVAAKLADAVARGDVEASARIAKRMVAEQGAVATV
jgi:DNA-binding FadR family transcriptional regulator